MTMYVWLGEDTHIAYLCMWFSIMTVNSVCHVHVYVCVYVWMFVCMVCLLYVHICSHVTLCICSCTVQPNTVIQMDMCIYVCVYLLCI